MKKKTRPSKPNSARPKRISPEARRDALGILSDDDIRAGLHRRRAALTERLADVEVDTLMPDWEKAPAEEKERQAAASKFFRAAIEDIDRRLAGASALLRAFSGHDMKPPAPSA